MRHFLACISFALLALAAGCEQPPAVVKIGVVHPMSGTRAPLGQDMFNGVKLAADEINKAGGIKLKGKRVPIELVVGDDRADPLVGTQVAQQVVDAGVVAVIGHLNSGVSIPAAPVYARANVAQLAISTNPKYTELGLPTTFRLVANDSLQAKAIGSYAVNQMRAERWAVVDDGTPYGKGLADSAAAELAKAKKTITLRESFDEKTVAFDDLAGKLKAGGIEGIVSTLNDYQIVALIDALKKSDYTTVSILGTDTLKTPSILKKAGQVSGIYCTSPILDAKEFPAGPKFLDAYKAAFKIEPAYGGHYSYDAMYVLADAIQKADSVKPEDIVKSLRSLNGYAPVTGSMRFDDKGEQRYGSISVYGVRNGAWEPLVRSDTW
ncbi:branched-chain amino acid ABC transporter substrate-binding protein [Ramlibacter sp. PS4R-6]|uniref:branched-chain amino acid ABC transporter substrate-binding protein n=1 Tax=Ramlibacter sp. PS4R-6 TaxID=3133438 RepID=UPI0030A70FE5